MTTEKSSIMNTTAINPTIFLSNDVGGISQHMLEHGYVVYRVDALDCRENVYNLWKHVILNQPWVGANKIVLHDPLTNLVLDIDEDRERFLDVVMSPLGKRLREYLTSRWTLHRGFGACCDPNIFHLDHVWKLSQDPQIYRIAAKILGRDDLWVDINRSVTRLPGEGEKELLHWDLNPFKPWTPSDAICGKVFYTPGSFVCVPGINSCLAKVSVFCL